MAMAAAATAKDAVGAMNLCSEKHAPPRAARRTCRRAAVLRDIVEVLSRIESHWRSPSARGVVATVDEQRMYNLIWSHADACISLYLTFKIRYSSPSSSPLSFSCDKERLYEYYEEEGEAPARRRKKRKRAKTEKKKEKEKEKRPLLLPRDLELKFSEVSFWIENCLIKPLQDCRRSITGSDPWESRRRNYKVRRPRAPNYDHPLSTKTLIDLCAGDGRVRLLADVLHSLEVLSEERGFAPPADQHGEIGCYREIVMLISSLFAVLFSRGAADPSLLGTSTLHSLGTWRISQGLSYYGQLLAVSLDLLPHYKSLLQERKARLAQILSRTRIDTEGGQPGGGQRLIRWKGDEEPKEVSLKTKTKTRLECLNIVVSKLDKIASLAPSNGELTDREFQLCAHIAEHVRSHIHLSESSTYLSHKAAGGLGTESCPVNVAEAIVEEVSPTADGDCLNSREQYLEEIVSYLGAIKPLFTADVLTMAELVSYRNLRSLLASQFIWCKHEISSPDPVGAEQAGKKEKKPIAWLKQGLVACKKRVREFLADVEREELDMLVLISEAIMPGSAAAKLAAAASSPRVAFELFKSRKEEVATELAEFFQQGSLGGIELLDELRVFLRDVEYLTSDICEKLFEALDRVDIAWREGENLSLLEREVISACCVMGLEH